ncbi:MULTISPECIES: hypothetical protein [Methanobacterium]|uniref:Uncharacterized protein n=1 Tax=Methanobacterium veterum TaxID=408577 RepID=A0A9E5A655_9EURY|nr:MULTISPECIES: hypothetical protein [Methanobacterium]MCZ3367062.1 hypothetical protein [Methanobacterium veterum]MCZ3373791.1 hypothetical protein [Methanobacterium veterum]
MKAGIKITLTLTEFKNFIDSLENKKEFYKSVTEISEIIPGMPFVVNSVEMLSLDDIVLYLKEEIPKKKEKCHDCLKSGCNLNFQYSSADALYVLSPNGTIELYFIEFKKMDIMNDKIIPDIEMGLDKLIENLKKIDEDTILINKIGEHLGHEIDIDNTKKLLKKSKKAARKSKKNLLYLKALESLYCIIPWSYKLYCQNKGIIPDVTKFKSFLAGCKKEYIIIQESCQKNPAHNRHKQYAIKFSCKENPSGLQRLSPYPFNKVKIRNGTEFTSFINEISK